MLPVPEAHDIALSYSHWRLLGVVSMGMTMAVKAFFDGIGKTWVHLVSALVMNVVQRAALLAVHLRQRSARHPRDGRAGRRLRCVRLDLGWPRHHGLLRGSRADEVPARPLVEHLAQPDVGHPEAVDPRGARDHRDDGRLRPLHEGGGPSSTRPRRFSRRPASARPSTARPPPTSSRSSSSRSPPAWRSAPRPRRSSRSRSPRSNPIRPRASGGPACGSVSCCSASSASSKA